jgi:hypothetical protein
MEKEMSGDKKETNKITVQIQEGFFPPNVPFVKGSAMAEDKKGRIDEGFVPQKAPARPSNKEDKGFVPPSSPRKPPEKPDKNKK